MVTLHLLGTPQVYKNGQEIRLKRRKSRALLFYVAAHFKPITREHLLALFWPDTERPAAQQILRTSLYGLRKEVEGVLFVQDDRLSLAPEVEIDLRSFVHLLSAAPLVRENLVKAMSIYRGELLEGFSLPDAPGFENWLAVERERYRRMAVRGLVNLSRSDESEGNYKAAAARIDEALAFDPLQEDLQREYIRLLYLAGDRPAAIQRYDYLRRLLDEELGVPPMLETRRLYDSILNDTLVTAPGQSVSVELPAPVRKKTLDPGSTSSITNSTTSEKIPISKQTLSKVDIQKSAASLSLSMKEENLPFVGRKAELGELRNLASQLPPENPARLVLVEGEPGIGKSRLAAEFIQSSQYLPVRGAAYELEQNIPYQPVIEALRSLVNSPMWQEVQQRYQLQPVWREETARLLPEIAPHNLAAHPPSPANEARLWEGLHQFLLAVARVHPIIFFLDDLQWADASTLGLLGYMVRQAVGPIMFLGTARTDQPRSALSGLTTALMRSGRLITIHLERLSETDLFSLASWLSSDYANLLTSWFVRNSEGNPFVLAELVRYGVENQIFNKDGKINFKALSTNPVVPQTVYSLTLNRLNQLSGSARRVLESGVASGREFEFEIVYRAAGLSEVAALDALDELNQVGLIRPVMEQAGKDGEALRYTFTHSTILEVAYQEIGEARYRMLHRRVAEALEKVYFGQLDEFEGQIAYHYTAGGDGTRARPYALRAGERAAGLAAWKEAVDFYEKALRGESNPSTRQKILVKLASARFQSGEMARASEDYRAAAALVEPGSEEEIEILLDLAESLLPQARFGEAISLVRQIHNHERQDLAMRALFLSGTSLSLEGADLDGAAKYLKLAEEYCRACSGPLPLAEIKFELGSVMAQLGDLSQAVALYREALNAAQEAGEEGLPRLILANNNLAFHLHLLNDPTARDYAEAGLALSEEKGLVFTQPYLYSTLGEIALAQQNLNEAEHFFSRGLSLAERHDIPERIAGLTANLGLLAVQRGQTDLAIHRLSSALARAENLGTLHLAAQIRIWLAPLLPLSEVRAHLVEARAIAESSKRKILLDEVLRLEKLLF
jgi:DNA-binding SARP family transcriptional activator